MISVSGVDAFVDAFLHEPTGLELHRSTRRNIHRLESLGILRDPGGTLANLEYPEVTELKAVTPAQLADDLIKKGLDGLLHISSGLVGVGGNAFDQFLFGGRGRFGLGGAAVLCHVCSSHLVLAPSRFIRAYRHGIQDSISCNDMPFH